MNFLSTALIASALLAPASISPSAAEHDVIKIQATEEGLSMRSLIDMASDILGRTYFYDEREVEAPCLHFSGDIEMPKDQFGPFFESALRQKDFVCVRIGSLTQDSSDNGGFWSVRRVAPGAKPGYLKSLARVISPDELDSYAAHPGLLVTTSIQLDHIEGRDAATVLTPYFADQFVESIRNIDSSNTLLMTGYASTLAGIKKLIEVIDHEEPNRDFNTVQYRLRHAVASEVRPILIDLIKVQSSWGPSGARAAQASPVKEPQILVDPRTNSLLLTGSEGQIEKLKTIIERLDVEVPRLKVQGPTRDELLERIKTLESVVEKLKVGRRPVR